MSAMDDRYTDRMVALEQEQSVIGCLLRLNRSIDQVGGLVEDDFFDAQHRTIYRTIVQLVVANKPADVMTVYASIKDQGKDIEIGYLSQMHQVMPSAANIASYCAVVRDRAIKRRMLALAHDMIEDAYSSAADGPALVDAAASKLEALGRANVDGEPDLAIESLSHHLVRMDEEYHGSASPAVATGITDLDIALNGGPRRGNLWVIAGRPKMGKTALALNIANHVAVGGVALVLSMEMGKAELHNRNLASIGRIDLNHLNSPKLLTDEEWQHLGTATEKIAKMRLYMDDQGGLTLMQVRGKAMQIKRKAGGLDLLVVDYLQLMSGPGDNRNAQIEAITRGLKALAKELDCVIALLSQLNRKLEDRPNKRPLPSDLRDSGSIEQDCDIATFVYQDVVYNRDSPDAGTAELINALVRQGASSTVRTAYIGHLTRFEDLAKGWHPEPPRSAPVSGRGFD